MADFNQFGSAKPGNLGGSGNSQQCAQCEAMLADALDGALSASDQATFDLHLAGCPSCTVMLADARRGAAWIEMLKSPRPEPPTALLERIIAQTSGKAAALANPPIVLGSTDRLRTSTTVLGRPTLVPSSAAHPAFASTNVLPFRTRITQGFRSLGHTMLQPRLAMTAAMAFFSIALTMNLTGVRLSALRASDFKPSSIMRSASQAKASVVRYTDNLRVVYELESRVRDLQRSSDDDGTAGTTGSTGTTPTQAPQNAPANGQKPTNGQQPDDQNQKPGSQKQNQKQTKPNPGSSRRVTSGGNIRLVESVPPRALPPFATQAFVVFNPSVFKQEGELV
ncbi:MAG TPA: zf-HC2 domain-containing protein [Edaphobacter sp.]|nr:zf-HC2 domain-containing protein [Edaphobacter sp.]